MGEFQTRSYTHTTTGKRVALRFEPEMWSAIDSIVKKLGLKNWATWVHSLPERYENRHVDVRSAVVSELTRSTLQPEYWKVTAPLLADSKVMTDAEFADSLTGDFTFVDKSPVNLGGFVVQTGDRNGAPTIWIRNNLRGQPNLVIPIPEIFRRETVHSADELKGDAA